MNQRQTSPCFHVACVPVGQADFKGQSTCKCNVVYEACAYWCRKEKQTYWEWQGILDRGVREDVAEERVFESIEPFRYLVEEHCWQREQQEQRLFWQEPDCYI